VTYTPPPLQSSATHAAQLVPARPLAYTGWATRQALKWRWPRKATPSMDNKAAGRYKVHPFLPTGPGHRDVATIGPSPATVVSDLPGSRRKDGQFTLVLSRQRNAG
jgi:hypothetical protein